MNDEPKQPEFCLAPPELDIGETEGFSKRDIFGYADFGGRLANIVRNLQTPLVLALTDGWGSGKSVFARQWAGELRKRWAENNDNRNAEDAPVIYFDAFANDHQKNALFALAGEVMEFIGRRKKTADKAGESVERIGKGVGGALAECAARFATMGAAGAGDVAEAMKTALDKRMEDAKDGRDAVREFQKALEDAAKELGDGQPLVFIVDELDRCRPDFALELLEKIKHLFSVPGVCFLVVTNLEQFNAVVRRAYGYDEKGARVYLEKFFHYVFWLPKEEKRGKRQVIDYVRHIWKVLSLPPDNDGTFFRWMEKLSQAHDFSLRDIERMLAPMVLVYASEMIFSDDRSHRIVDVLCVLRKIDPVAYQKILQADATWEDMPELLKNDDWAALELSLIKEKMNEKEAHRHFLTLNNEMHDPNAQARRNYVADIAKKIENYAR